MADKSALFIDADTGARVPVRLVDNEDTTYSLAVYAVSDELIVPDAHKSVFFRDPTTGEVVPVRAEALGDGTYALAVSGAVIVGGGGGSGVRRFDLLTNGDELAPELVFDSFGQVIWVEME